MKLFFPRGKKQPFLTKNRHFGEKTDPTPHATHALLLLLLLLLLITIIIIIIIIIIIT